MSLVIPRVRMHSEVYGSVFVSVCLGCYSCSGIDEVQVKSFYRLLVRFSIVDLQNNASSLSFGRLGLLTWNAIVAFSEQCIAKLGHGVLLLYLLLVAAKVRTKLHICTSAAAINFMDFELLVSFLATIMVDHFPLLYQCKFCN